MRTLKHFMGLIALLVSVAVYGQAGTADKAWQKRRYQDAADLYLKEYKADSTNIIAIQRLAMTNQYLGNFEEAEGWYSLWIQEEPGGSPERTLNYAQLLASNKKYELSRTWYRKYAQEKPDDTRGMLFDKAYGDMGAFFRDSLSWKINYLSLNTTADEYAPMKFNDALIFTSNRIKSVFLKLNNEMKREPFSDLYIVYKPETIEGMQVPQSTDTMEVSRKRKPLDAPVASSDNRPLYTFNNRFLYSGNPYFGKVTPANKLSSVVNTRLYEGCSTYNPSTGMLVYSTSNLAADSLYSDEQLSGNQQLKLVMVKYMSGEWVKKQDFDFIRSDYSVTHPAFSQDGSVLFFVSDMPGGFGGTDIYYSVMKDSIWSQP
ncbi:MAG: hypothetical protein V4616_11815, partial [Bacteroidota bacterium]